MKFKLTFGKSPSTNFKKALILAKDIDSFRETEVDGYIEYSVEYDETNFFQSLPLYNIIANWKTAKFMLNYRYVQNLNFIYPLIFCYERKGNLGEAYCFDRTNTGDRFIFGCRELRLDYHFKWFSFGELRGRFYFIDKDSLMQNLLNEISNFR